MNFHQVTVESINYLKEVSTGLLTILFSRLHLKRRLATQNIWFLNMCLQNKVFPKYIQLKTKNHSPAAQKGIHHGQTRWLKQDRKYQYKKRDIIAVYLKVCHSELNYRLNNIEFDILDSNVRINIDNIIDKKFNTQCKKLNNLISNSKKPNIHYTKSFSNHTFFNRFINLTDTKFSNSEIQLLEKGFKHNLPQHNNERTLEYLGVECEVALNKTANNIEKSIIAKSIRDVCSETKNSCYKENKTAISIKNKSIENNIVFTKADKGNTTIAIDKIEYNNKTIEFLNNQNIETLHKDPTEKYQKQIKLALENSKSILNPIEQKYLNIMNPQPPKLYSFIKLHKPDHPIRPVVSFYTAPSYKISKKLLEIILDHTKFSPKFTIKNTIELVNKIQHFQLPNNSRLISFDVKNLFPSIPPTETFILVKNLLDQNSTNPIITSEILHLLEVCINQDYFEFNNKIYTNNSAGLIMGNPLSPLLSDIFMDHLETKISKHPVFKQFLYWWRYVDDVLVCFTGTNRQLDQFLSYINSVHSHIQFTIETEQNQSINFLDLKISRLQNKHDFSIFHKPTHTDTTIHNSSSHPTQHKLAAYHSMLHRLTEIPMSKYNFETELNIIKQIAVNNGYNEQTINKMLNQKLHKKALKLVFPPPEKKPSTFCSITYTGKITTKIAKHIKKKGITPAFRTNNNLGKYIKNNKSQNKKHLNSGVYKLQCGDCPKTYIGQTGRNFDKRIAEHKRAFKNRKTDSTYALHLLDHNHSFNDKFKILHIQNKGLKLSLLESMEINKLKNTDIILNDQLETNSSPLLNLFH